MSQKRSQKTPKGHEIPVPTRKAFFDNLDKVAKPDAAKAKSSRRRRAKQ